EEILFTLSASQPRMLGQVILTLYLPLTENNQPLPSPKKDPEAQLQTTTYSPLCLNAAKLNSLLKQIKREAGREKAIDHPEAV
ncbi:hypothetical protein ACQP3J_33155, partial [Escherichia coli]